MAETKRQKISTLPGRKREREFPVSGSAPPGVEGGLLYITMQNYTQHRKHLRSLPPLVWRTTSHHNPSTTTTQQNQENSHAHT